MKKLFLLLTILIPEILLAQTFHKPDYPKNYFRDPLDIPMILAGNVGEIRPNHFHSGLDIKTNGVQGLQVHAAADGYIARVGVSNSGFGNVIYINHPNGYTTVYGHLSRFAPKLAEYVKAEEYKKKSWAIDLDIPANLFPVNKDDLIAYSGNTGGALAPHLHFEIRNTNTQHPLNGLLFGFDVKDNVPPQIFGLAVYDRNRSIYEQEPQIYATHKSGGRYSLSHSLIKVTEKKVGFGIHDIDRETGTHNTYGIYEASLYDNGKLIEGFRLDDIGYEETRYVNAHIDYKLDKSKNLTYELLFSLPGNKLPIYDDFAGTNGKVDISDNKVHHIRIVLKDAYMNASTLEFDIQHDAGTEAHYTTPADCKELMYPGVKNIFENKRVQFYLNGNLLYDTICFRYKEIPLSGSQYYSPLYRLHTAEVPLDDYYTLRLKLDKAIPNNLRNKLVIVRKGEGETVQPAAWDNEGWLKANFRNFGDFTIQADVEPPVIIPLGGLKQDVNLSNANKISFRIGDNLSGIGSYNAYLDGKWLLFDQYRKVIYYEFDEHCPPGNHTLTLTVTDRVGNAKIYTLHFKR